MNRFALIGHPLGHSMSPLIHEKLFALSGIEDASYELIDIAPENIPESRQLIESLRGLNVTIPHKQSVIRLVDVIAESAERYNSVNCINCDNGTLTGYNTDCDGFLRSAKELPIGGNVVILGCGGVGRMMATECYLHGAQLTVTERDLPRAQALAGELQSRFPDAKGTVRVMEAPPAEDFDLLMNATPVGMYPRTDACPVADAVIERSGRVFDVIYNPTETQLIRRAKALGKDAVGGSAMLVWQAAVAQSIWNGTQFAPEDIWALVRDMQDEVDRQFAVK